MGPKDKKKQWWRLGLAAFDWWLRIDGARSTGRMLLHALPYLLPIPVVALVAALYAHLFTPLSTLDSALVALVAGTLVALVCYQFFPRTRFDAKMPNPEQPKNLTAEPAQTTGGIGIKSDGHAHVLGTLIEGFATGVQARDAVVQDSVIRRSQTSEAHFSPSTRFRDYTNAELKHCISKALDDLKAANDQSGSEILRQNLSALSDLAGTAVIRIGRIEVTRYSLVYFGGQILVEKKLAGAFQRESVIAFLQFVSDRLPDK